MFLCAVPAAVFPITLVRVGYLDIDLIVTTYTERYLDGEISIRETFVEELYTEYNDKYFEMSLKQMIDSILFL